MVNRHSFRRANIDPLVEEVGALNISIRRLVRNCGEFVQCWVVTIHPVVSSVAPLVQFEVRKVFDDRHGSTGRFSDRTGRKIQFVDPLVFDLPVISSNRFTGGIPIVDEFWFSLVHPHPKWTSICCVDNPLLDIGTNDSNVLWMFISDHAEDIWRSHANVCKKHSIVDVLAI
ncbi:hypothetical protein D3C75_981130 [compost metagenome]